ncbi:MAG TPA: heparan-alpha-glucosaminide N-acetyltransferase domain-containing protein [Acidobacteriota bacterium]|nr:heparan-alpha-glucosaminide N-acetyltransferase domain-containing protein [Acidobacteriota bacterium]
MAESVPLSPAKAPRYGFIDLLRGFALVVMVETHVMNAYLPHELKKDSVFFFWLAFLNGLVAPTFLFATGFSLMLQGSKQWENWLGLRLAFWKQMRRLGFIALVAYYSHLQGFRWSRYVAKWNDNDFWAKSLKVDVLQCIVVSLLVVIALMFIVRKKSLLPWAAMLLAMAVSFVTPWMWAQDFRDRLPLPLALFLNPHGISLFPIFPWIVFVLAGSAICCFFLHAVEKLQTAAFMRNIAGLGILLIVGGLLMRDVPYTIPGYVNFYTTSPLYILIRIGCVLIISYLLYQWEVGGKGIPRLIQMAGQESLLVYGVHLWVIFGFLRGRILGPKLGLQMGYPGCFTMSIAIIILMLYLAKYYHLLKKQFPERVRQAQFVIVIVMTLIFFLS